MPIVVKRICCLVAALGSAMALLAIPSPGVAPLVAKAHAQAASAGQAASTATAGGITLRSTPIDLPGTEQMFPGDTSAQAINNDCLGCHSTDMVLTQPALGPSSWREEIGKMRTAYKAPVPEEDVPAIIAYLVSLRTNE